MNTEIASATEVPDPAAVFSCALSLWRACEARQGFDGLNLSECYNGMDQLMREVMRIANQFEAWACSHIDFTRLNDVWPYLLEDKFGATCLVAMLPTGLAAFDESDCLRAAMWLGLPIIADGKLPVPMDVSAPNPVADSAFKQFRIQTVRDEIEGDDSAAFTMSDEPFDDDFGVPYFGLYGVGENGLLEFIASRATYGEVVKLARKLAPGINFPDAP